jgi:hypothetical protein
MMTSSGSTILEDIKRRIARPSVRQRARLYPEHTYVHTLSGDAVALEHEAISYAIDVGYSKACDIDTFEPFELAVKVLVRQLEKIAAEQSIYDLDWEYTVTSKNDVEVTFVFDNISHAVQFKLATSLL